MINLKYIQLLQGILIILLSPLISGGLKWSKAFWQGRKRHWSYIFQPYRDLYKLMRVPTVHPKTASWVFSLSPAIVLAAYITLIFALPVLVQPLFSMNLLMVIYILGLARFMLSIAGWDTGGTFGSLGGNREMFLHILIEISLFISILPLAICQHTLSLSDILGRPIRHDDIYPQIVLSLSLPAVIGAFILETGHSPVGNPESHLELTMTSKAVLLEFSGDTLMLLEIGDHIRLSFLLMICARFMAILLSSIFLPWKVENNVMILITMACFLGLLELLSWWDVSRPKMRLSKVHLFIGFITLWAGAGILLALALT